MGLRVNELKTDTEVRDTATPLAIVGIGCLFPKADGLGGYWANVKHGVDCIAPVPPTHWDPADYFDPDPKRPDMTYARRGGFLAPVDFNPLEFGIAPRDIEATDTSQLLGLVAAKQALLDAGIVFADRSPKRERGSAPSRMLRAPTASPALRHGKIIRRLFISGARRGQYRVKRQPLARGPIR